MKKIYLPLCFFLSIYSQLSAQILVDHTPPVNRCATYEVLQAKRRIHPGGETDQQFETWLRQKIYEAEKTSQRQQATVVLPVVFHIIHDNEVEGTGDNISVAAIHQQLLQLNKDYANLTNSPYGVAANTEVQFALAQNDPGGTPLLQPGIDRIDRNSIPLLPAPPYTVGFSSSSDQLNDDIKPATIWDPARYINIWVLTMESNILGIATFPLSSGLSGLPGAGEDNFTAGMAVIPESVGSMFVPNGSCNISYSKGRTLTHEMGHFFGLRHIWGDAGCGNDFCGDTPVHLTSNGGVPVHPKPNSCGTADEMFENYMDYSDDIVMNTFTVDQKARMQAVLTNSPRRNTLAGSNAGLVPATATNRIAFSLCSGAMTVSETGLVGNSPRYKDISLNLNVEDKATGNATITINTGGTAINNFDYQVLTPSVAFVANDDYKAVNIRIFDDALLQGNNTIVVSYTISGSGVTAGPSAQTVTITITDNDAVNLVTGPVTLLSQDFSGSLAGWSGLSSGGMPNLFVVSNGGDAGGSGNCAYISNSTVAPFANTYTKTTAGLAVLRTPLINANGIINLSLTFKYKVFGEDDGGIWDFGKLTYARQTASTSFFNVPAVGAGPYVGTSLTSGNPIISLPNSVFSNTAFYLGFWWENDNNSGSDPALNIDDIVLTGTGDGIETAVSDSYGSDVQAGAGINNFKSVSNRAIVRVTNTSQAISGLTAAIAESGTGTVPLVTTAGSFNRSQKVITLVPSVANTTVSYQATLYFTVSELSPAWSAAEIANLKIMKIKDGVNLSGVISAADAVLIIPTFSNNSASGYYSYTGNFTGFSQFLLVSPNTALPVHLLTFGAKPVNRTIALNWSTSEEVNNKGFGIERSADGVNYKNIGWMNGRINCSDRSDYSYKDLFVQPGTTYYYRLRQTDLDGRDQLSVIRQARIEEPGIVVTMSPNPATDHVSLFISGSSGLADVNILNAQGQLIRSWKNLKASEAPARLSTSGLASGLYLVNIQLPGETRVEKLLVE